MNDFRNYYDKAEELKIQTSQLLRHYNNPKSTAKEFHDQRAKVDKLISELNIIKTQIKEFIL